MVGTKVASKYAKALFAVAQRAGLLDAVQQELHQLRDLMEENPELRQVLEHPRMEPSRKKSLLRRVLGEHVSELTLDFLSLLVDKKRAEALLTAVQEFDRLLDEARKIQRAEVRSAIPLPDDLADALTQKLADLTGKQIILSRVIEPELIGGLVIHVAGRLIDGSIASHLDAVRDHLHQARVVEVT